MTWRKRAAENEMKSTAQMQKVHEHVGAIDILIVSAPVGEPWCLVFKKSQLKGTAFTVFKKFLRALKPPNETFGWAFTWDPDAGVWYCLSSSGVPNHWKVGEFLSDPDVASMLRDSNVVRTLTYRAEIRGANITKDDAIQNSLNWEAGEEAPAPELDEIPASTDDFMAEAAGSSRDHATEPARAASPATQPRRGRR